MSAFISWSGTRSQQVATVLHRLIEQCLGPAPVWASHVDMESGVDWFRELAERLGDARVGIVCITAGNLESPWILFEAGAMLKAGRLIPYLVDVQATQLPPPLQHYHARLSTYEDTLELLRAVNDCTEPKVDDKVLCERFGAFWVAADRVINGRSGQDPIPQRSLGVIGIYANRSEAFEDFSECIIKELAPGGQQKRLWIIGSSLQGFIHFAGGFPLWDSIKSAAAVDCLRILLTAPEISHLREDAEIRNPGQISAEIKGTLRQLIVNHEIPRKFVKLCGIPPSVSAVATSSHMLLNPFPIGQSSFNCFCLVVSRTGQKSVYDQYIEHHFEKGWEFGRELTDGDVA